MDASKFLNSDTLAIMKRAWHAVAILPGHVTRNNIFTYVKSVSQKQILHSNHQKTRVDLCSDFCSLLSKSNFSFKPQESLEIFVFHVYLKGLKRLWISVDYHVLAHMDFEKIKTSKIVSTV